MRSRSEPGGSNTPGLAGGKLLRPAAIQAVRDRFRAIFLTSITTIAGMTPLLFEPSSQALIR